MICMRLARAFFPLLLVSAASPGPLAHNKAAESTDSVVGKLVALTAERTPVVLSGPRDVQQLIVTGKYADGSMRDLTGVCDYQIDSAGVARVASGGLVSASGNGSTRLTIRAGTQTVRVSVTVSDFDKPAPVSFRREVIAAFNVSGCNAGACHGTPNGKNGFRLSLRGYDPQADHVQLTRDLLGRRTDSQDAAASLLLLKATGQVPHEGGVRFQLQSTRAGLLRDWLAQGMPFDPADLPTVKRLEILPGPRVLKAPARRQQLAVLAHFSDGSSRDVTPLTVFSSSESAVAEVSPSGLVEFRQSGEVAILCRYLQTLQSVNLGYLESKVGFKWPNPPEANYVDKHVFAKLKMLSIPPSDLCSDLDFMRRAHLDLCATLPTPAEVKKYIADTSKNKRAKLIDSLLEREEYAEFWSLKWMDVLRGTRRTLQHKGAQVYRQWIREHLEKNTPMDQVVTELLTAKGNTFASGPANFYRIFRQPEELGETTAQLFLGVRLQCCKCHNHPFEKWTQDDYYGTAAFFAQVQQKTGSGRPAPPRHLDAEVIGAEGRGEVKHLRTGKTMQPRFLGGELPSIPAGKDRREVLAGWLTAADNPFLARALVNRLWYHLMGRGIVEPVDDFRDSNPPANEALLDALARDFVAHKFDTKQVIRTIMNSRTYQLSAQSNEFNRDDVKYCSHVVPRLLTAEQLLDAVCFSTDVLERFQGVSTGARAIQLPDGDVDHPFLKSFGQPARDIICECERQKEANLTQALQMINGGGVHAKLTTPRNRIGKLMSAKLNEFEMLRELYLATLSRPPSDAEAREHLGFLHGADNKREAWEDIQWALLNSKEFMYRH